MFQDLIRLRVHVLGVCICTLKTIIRFKKKKRHTHTHKQKVHLDELPIGLEGNIMWTALQVQS